MLGWCSAGSWHKASHKVQEHVISKLKRGPVYAIMTLFVLSGLLVLLKIWRGDDMSESMYYSAYGNWTIIFFFACLIVAVVTFARMLNSAEAFLQIEGDRLAFGTKKFHVDEIVLVSVVRSGLGFETLRLDLAGGSRRQIGAFMLERPLEEIAHELRAWQQQYGPANAG